MSKKRRVCAALLAGILALSAAACGKEETKETSAAKTEQDDGASKDGASDPVRVGVCLPLSGDMKVIGEYISKGADLAEKEINQAGGVMDRELELVYFDTLDSVQTTTNAIKLAIDDGELAMLYLNTYTSHCLAAMPFIEEAKMPTLIGGSGNSIADEKNPYVWQHRVLDGYSGIAMANYTADTLKPSEIAIIHQTNQSNVEQKDVMVSSLKEKGIEVPDGNIIAVSEEEKNYAPIVAQVKAMGADCLMLQMTPGSAGLLANAIKDAALDITVIGPSTITQSAAVETGGKNMDGWYCVSEYINTKDTPENETFVSLFETEYGEKPDASNLMGYDAVYLIKEAIENAGTDTDPEAVNAGMGEISGLKLAAGDYTSYEDHTMMSELLICKMEGGVPQYIDTVKYR